MIVGATVQVIIAIALAIILFVIAFSVYNQETIRAMQEAGKVRRTVPIFTGVKDLIKSQDEVFNTIDPLNPTYRNLYDSVNQPGGAEYTYNFWMYISADSFGSGKIFRNGNIAWPGTVFPDAGLTPIDATKQPKKGAMFDARKPLALLLRGNKKAYAYKNLCSNSTQSRMKVDVLVKNPMIMLENNGDVLSVEVNTLETPNGVKENSRNTCDERNGDWENVNSYRVAVKGLRTSNLNNWFMVTVVVQDTYPGDPLPMRNKVRVRIYINGEVKLDKYLDGQLGNFDGGATVLKNNSGNLYIAPVIKMGDTELTRKLSGNTNFADKIRMADLTYYNYAIDPSEVASLFENGFTTSYASSSSQLSSTSDSSSTNIATPGADNIIPLGG